MAAPVQRGKLMYSPNSVCSSLSVSSSSRGYDLIRSWAKARVGVAALSVCYNSGMSCACSYKGNMRRYSSSHRWTSNDSDVTKLAL